MRTRISHTRTTSSNRRAIGGALLLTLLIGVPAFGELRVGAAVTDVSPTSFPVLINGGMLSRTAEKIKTPVEARALVLDDGAERLAIVVVDSCMMPRPLLDEAKQLAAERTGIPADRMLMSATHTHSAPSCMGCLGTDADAAYVPYLREKLAQAVAAAAANLEPAKAGWAVENAAEFTALRRWIRRPDRMDVDPFGNRTVRANMHAGRVWDDVTGESGPEDPALTILSFVALDGRPIAALANFSMHYFGDEAVSADYFGKFRDGLQEHAAPRSIPDKPPFVAVLSHGCSGDIWRRDYTKPVPPPAEDHTIDSFTQGLLAIAIKGYDAIRHEAVSDIRMTESRMTLNYRVPDAQRLEWARRVVSEMGDRLPKDTAEVYAREQVLLHERQSTEVVVQAVRIGDMAIATTPNETYALSGLKIKHQSPLNKTMVIELANGGDGYIPPPEQHLLGGYNTWPARSAGLEVQAEPRIVEAALQALETVSGRTRGVLVSSRGPASDAILAKNPAAYWRLDDMAGPRMIDAGPHARDAIYEPGVVFFLDGPRSNRFCLNGETNRAAHFAGGRALARIPDLPESYSVSLWFWNGMPVDGRGVAGWLVSRGRDHGLDAESDQLGLGGSNAPGRIIFQHGKDGDHAPSAGTTEIPRWTWNHVVLVRDGSHVRVYLNGTVEIDAAAPADFPPRFDQIFLGGRCDRMDGWEGRIDEVAVFDRPLSAEEIASLARAAALD
ncbi:MAG: hypothetical protein FJ297_15145 [Planctomycetes bacterium]|nr:hypothetical protein [Planctomycetota bacterium]